MTSDASQKRGLSAGEAMNSLGIGERRLLDLAANGRIRFRRDADGSIRYNGYDVRKLARRKPKRRRDGIRARCPECQADVIVPRDATQGTQRPPRCPVCGAAIGV